MAAPRTLKRDAGIIGLLYASLGSIIGSGWLFGALHAASAAGPWSVFSWVIGAGAILLIAFVYAELTTLFPNSGALIHITHISHGNIVGKLWSWILFLTIVSVPAVEVMAVLTYANSYLPGLIQPDSGLLTSRGYVCAASLLALVVGLNFFAVRWVVAINSTITWWKLAVPVATIVILLAYAHEPHNLTTRLDTAPVSGMLTAVATAGVVFSFFGFQQVITIAGEARNPGRTIPIALIGSVVIGMLIYVGLQLAFLLALDPNDLKNGWPALSFSGMYGPLAAIAVAVGAFWWAVVLYVDAIISPLGTAFILATGSPRILMAAGEMGNAPRAVTRLSRQGVPWIGLIVAYLIGLVLFFPFPSWQKLVGAVSMLAVLAYAIGPVQILAIRRALPDAKRPFRLRAAHVISTLAFIVANWIIYWTGYHTITWLLSFVCVYLLGLFLWTLFRWLMGHAPSPLPAGWQYAGWVVPYLGGLWLVSYFGPAQQLGGHDGYSFFTGMLLLAIFSPLIQWLAVVCRQPDALAKATADKVARLGTRGK